MEYQLIKLVLVNPMSCPRILVLNVFLDPLWAPLLPTRLFPTMGSLVFASSRRRQCIMDCNPPHTKLPLKPGTTIQHRAISLLSFASGTRHGWCGVGWVIEVVVEMLVMASVLSHPKSVVLQVVYENDRIVTTHPRQSKAEGRLGRVG